jgi:hypothetical protein
MKLDDIRQEVIELVAKVHPEMQAGVFNPDAFRSHYLTPFRARDLKALEKYERQHNTIFCRQCLTRDEKKGLLLVHQLWIEETDNGLENKPGEWVSLQCQNPDCDFDLVTPRPEGPNPAKEHAERIEKLLEQYKYNQWQQMNTPTWITNTGTTTWPSSSGLSSSTVTAPHITISPITGQSAAASSGQALSSAGTLSAQAAPNPEESLLEKLKAKYLK